MKATLRTLLMLMLALGTALSLTSCEDEEIAYTLEGTWEGNTYMASIWNGQTYNSTRSVVNFNRDPLSFASGTGY